MKLPGFPDFEKMVGELKNASNEGPQPSFEVCVPVPNGLAIKQNLVNYWSGMDQFSVDIQEVVKSHNEKYNPHGVKRGASDNSTSDLSSVFPVAVVQPQNEPIIEWPH